MVPTVFSEEHEALRLDVRRWAEQRLGADAGIAGLAAEAGSLGYLETGGDVLAAVVVAEEVGRARSGGVGACLLAQAHAGVPVLRAAGSAPELAEGALAGGPPVALLDGGPHAVLNAHRASALVVLADDRVVLHTAGWTAGEPSGLLGWDGADVGDVVVPDGGRELARGPQAAALAALQRTRWWLVDGAAAVAGAWRTWEEARAYALGREAFGRPVARFQVNRHALAEAATRLTAARALVHDLAYAAARGSEEKGQAATIWNYAARVAADVTDACLQLHGGYGYAMEYPVQRAWRDARMHPCSPGADRAHDELLAALHGS